MVIFSVTFVVIHVFLTISISTDMFGDENSVIFSTGHWIGIPPEKIPAYVVAEKTR